MKSKKILFIIYDLERGGPELRLLDFSKHFPEDIKIHTCVTSNNLSLINEFKKTNVDIKVIPIAKPYLEFNKVKSIYNYVKDNEISIINSFDLKSYLISLFIKFVKRTNIKIIHHNVNSFKTITLRHKITFWIFLKFADTCICNSAFSKAEIKNKYISENKIEVIYNGIDTSHFRQNPATKGKSKEKLNINKNEIVLGTIANFRKQKNYPFLLDVFNTLLKSHPNLKLICVGGGAYLQKIKKIARNYGINENVIFTGYTKDVVSYLNIMDIFILSSSLEGSPNVILQAMSVGVPVVSSAVGGCPEIIENLKTGILFTPNNKAELINGIERLLEDNKLAAGFSRRAKTAVTKKFSLNNLITNYVNFYRQL